MSRPGGISNLSNKRRAPNQHAAETLQWYLPSAVEVFAAQHRVDRLRVVASGNALSLIDVVAEPGFEPLRLQETQGERGLKWGEDQCQDLEVAEI